jgi:hypothetical protein
VAVADGLLLQTVKLEERAAVAAEVEQLMKMVALVALDY